MYVIAVAIGVVFGILVLFSREMVVPAERGGIWKVLDRVSTFILRMYKRVVFKNNINDSSVTSAVKSNIVASETNSMNGIDSVGLRGTDIGRCLEQLSPGGETKRLRESYMIQKISLTLLIILVGTLFGVTIKYTSEKESLVIDSDGRLMRNDFLGTSTEVSVQAVTEEFDGIINFTMQPRKLTDEEVEELLPDFYRELEAVLCAENESLDKVDTQLNPVVRLSKYPFAIRWGTSDYGLISPSDGKISEVEETCQVVMTAYFKYGSKQWSKEFIVTLIPREYARSENIRHGLERDIRDSEEQSREEEALILPNEYNGKEVTWKSVSNDNSVYIWVAVLIVAVTVFFLSDKDLEKKVAEKKEKMKREYSEIARKLALYIGAGMTVRAAFIKIAAESVDRKSSNPIYLEMLFTCRELKSGISEEEVYERFGRRTGVQEYIRLSTLLQQNIKRGSNNLLGRLREEAENASLERLQACRKKGEEATTKLLLPMVLMLLVVMVVIMLPAFSSMNL